MLDLLHKNIKVTQVNRSSTSLEENPYFVWPKFTCDHALSQIN